MLEQVVLAALEPARGHRAREHAAGLLSSAAAAGSQLAVVEHAAT
jgi:hypothetical protein